jgi:uncharacterized protein (DUF362 family)
MEQNPPETVEAVARFVREEAARLLVAGVNWKITLNGSAGGNVRAVVETYKDLIRRAEQVSQE